MCVRQGECEESSYSQYSIADICTFKRGSCGVEIVNIKISPNPAIKQIILSYTEVLLCFLTHFEGLSSSSISLTIVIRLKQLLADNTCLNNTWGWKGQGLGNADEMITVYYEYQILYGTLICLGLIILVNTKTSLIFRLFLRTIFQHHESELADEIVGIILVFVTSSKLWRRYVIILWTCFLVSGPATFAKCCGCTVVSMIPPYYPRKQTKYYLNIRPVRECVL